MGVLESLGLAFPAAAYFLAIAPLLLIAYLARERPRQAIVSSVLAFRALHVMRGERFGGRPRLSWTFFLELLILCLAVLAIARPYLMRKGVPIAAVIDNSASMQARMPDGKTRFDAALAAARDALGAESGASRVTLYATAPRPAQVGAFSSAGAAAAALKRLKVTDAPDDPAAVASLLNQLESTRSLGRIIFASYRAIAPPVPARFKSIVTGEPIVNFAIGSFNLTRESLGEPAPHARVAVANFSTVPQTLKVTLTGDGKSIAQARQRVEAGAVASLDFPNLAAAQIYRARLEPADAFALDNTAYAAGSAVKAVSILFVSPSPNDGRSLKSIPGVTVTALTPGAYSPKELAAADLAIFEYTVPKVLPAASALLVMPPPGDPVFNFNARAAAQVQITGWPSTGALTDGVNFRLLNMRSGEYLGEHPWMQAIVSGSGGGLIMAGVRQGHRYVATGFNPFPYLGRQNLPVSILTLNLLSYLAGLGSQAAGFRTGQPWVVPAGVTQIVSPSGRGNTVTPGGQFDGANEQGIYTLIGSGGGKTARAVNLADLTASDLENAAPIRIDAVNGGAAAGESVVRTPLAPWLIAAILALIALEAPLVYRRRRPLVEP
jgi:hypothetical protein